MTHLCEYRTRLHLWDFIYKFGEGDGIYEVIMQTFRFWYSEDAVIQYVEACWYLPLSSPQFPLSLPSQMTRLPSLRRRRRRRRKRTTYSRSSSSSSSRWAPPPLPQAPSPHREQETGEQGRCCSSMTRGRREVVKTKAALEGTAAQTRTKVQWGREHVGGGACLSWMQTGMYVPSVHSSLVLYNEQRLSHLSACLHVCVI